MVGAVEEGEEQAPAELEANAVTLSHCFTPGSSFSETIMHVCRLLINRAASVLKTPLALARQAELPVGLAL